MRVRSFKSRPDANVGFFPLLGHPWYLNKDYLEKGDSKAEAKAFRKNFPNCRFRVTNFGRRPLILLRDEQLLKEYAKNVHLYDRAPLVQIFIVMIGNGLIYNRDELWKQHRKVISASFNYDLLKNSVPLIRDTTIEFISKITPQDMQSYPVIAKAAQITGEIIGRLFFGEKLNNYEIDGKPLTMELNELTAEVGALEIHPLSFIFRTRVLDLPFHRFRTLKQRLKRFRSVCTKIISDRKASSELGNDLLGRLLTAQKNCPGNVFSDSGIIDEFGTVFMVGMITAGNVVGILLHCLIKHPEYLADLKKERAATYNTEGTVTIETLQKMDILHAVVKEILRLHSPFPFISPRVSLSDHLLGDIQIKKGDIVEGDLLTTFYDGKIFENPTVFNPNRWKDPSLPEDPYSYIPFSAGPKNCLGQHLGMTMIKIVASEILNRFDVKLKDNSDLKFIMTGIYQPDRDILLELTPTA